MNFSRFLTDEELKDMLVKLNKNTKIESSGQPLTYDDENIYINEREEHSIVIGSTGSGKTQTCVLPKLRLSIMAGESFIINDIKGEIYEKLSGELKKRNYKTIVLNFREPNKGNCLNPLSLAYDLYKEGNKEKAMDIIENVAYYLLAEKRSINSDPFWENSAINYFTGLALYLINNVKKEEVNFSSIMNLSNEIENDKDLQEKLLNKDGITSPIYNYLAGILKAPEETKGSILSVFRQKMRLIISRDNLNSMLSNTDFDVKEVCNGKMAIFIIAGHGHASNILSPMIVDELYNVVNLYGNSNRINIILDEFGTLFQFRNIIEMLKDSRSIGIRFTLLIESFLDLENNYGKEVTELIKFNAPFIVYLLSFDINTIKEISQMCGMTEKRMLITIEELKLLETFEAIVLLPRKQPIKTKLIPDYYIDWEFSDEKVELKENNDRKIQIYSIK